MTTQKLVGALNRQTVEALIEKVYLTPDASGALASKEDRSRAMRAAQLIDSHNKKINRQQLLNSLFPTTAGSSQSDNLRFFRSRLAREAKAKLGMVFELVDDKQTNLPDHQRWLWFEGPDPTEMMVDEAIGNANYRDAKHYSPQHSISLNSAGQHKRTVKYFVSLAHDDDEAVNRFLKLFKRNLKGAKNFEFVVWQDKMIEIGQDWREQIKRAINECEFGLLLLSPGFFASDFIKQSELPNFVSSDGTIDGLKKAIPVCLKPVSWGATDTYGVEAIQVFGVNPRAFSECLTTSKQEQFCKDLFEKLMPLLPLDSPAPPPLTNHLSGSLESNHACNTMAAISRLADHPVPDFYPNYARLITLETAIDGRPSKKTGFDANSARDSADLHQRPDELAINELLQWASDVNRAPYMAMLGELGIGKTTNLKEFRNCLMHSRSSNGTWSNTLPIPIYLDLRLLVTLAKRSKTNHDALLMLNDSEQIVDWLLGQTFTSTGNRISAGHLRDLLSRNQAVVIFDSLDEILVQLGTAEAGTFVNTLYRFLPKDTATRRPLGKMIVACRTHYFRTIGAQNSTLLQQDRGEVRSNDFEALLLLPFDSSQIRTYLSNSLEIQDPKRLDEIMALFASIHNLIDLGSRPLNLWLLKDQIPALERLKAQGRTIRAVDIYDMLIERWLLRDHEKHVMDEGLKPVLMQYLATALWASKQRAWTAAQLDQWLTEFRQSNRSFNLQVVDQSIGSLKEDLRNSTFVTREGDSDLFRFAHSSMQEFFLAKAMFSALTLNVNDATRVWSGPIVSDETFGFFAELLQSASATENATLLDAMRTLADGGGIPIQSQVLMYFALANENSWQTPVLAGLTFKGLDLQHFRLHSNNQADSNLINLRCTTWNATFANESHFSNVDFSGASFNGMKAVGACFENCVFTDCSYVQSSFSGSDFRSCEFGFFSNLEARNKLLQSDTFRGALFYKTAVNASASADLYLKNAAPSSHFGHTSLVTSVAISPDGKHIVGGSDEDTIKVWDAYTGRCEQTLQGHQSAVTSIALSPDGKHIVSGSVDNTIKVWDAYTGRCEQTLQGHQSFVTSVALSPDGKRIISGSDDNMIKVWDVYTGRCEQTLQGHQSAVTSVALSPDGKRIVSGSVDNTVKVWDAYTGRCEQTFHEHQGWVTFVAMSTDGQSFAAASLTGISIFESTSQEEFRLKILIHLGRNSMFSVDTVKNTFIELAGDAWRYARWHVPSPVTELGSQGRDDLWLPADAFDAVN